MGLLLGRGYMLLGLKPFVLEWFGLSPVGLGLVRGYKLG